MPPLLFDSVSIPRVPAEVAYGMAGYDDDMDDSFPAPVVSWATKPVSGGKRRTTSASTFMTGANLESPIAPVVDGNLPVDTPGVGTHPAKVSERTRTSSVRLPPTPISSLLTVSAPVHSRVAQAADRSP